MERISKCKAKNERQGENEMYEKFDLQKSAKLALNYITSMVDPNIDNLPYWLIIPHKKPAEAAHCRVDDAELVASWYQAISCLRRILKTDEGAEVEASFKRHLMKSWGEHGLRFHEDYPWSCTNHSSFHEMAYVLAALNQMLQDDPNNTEAEQRSYHLVRGMRSLVIERKVRTFWSGDSDEEEPLYEFPNDVYLRDKGFDLSRHTGRGEQPIRNGMMLHALVRRYELSGDEVALDLASGLANFLLGPSRYFNYKMEFFGHVHSAGWVASGLVALGRVTQTPRYVEKGRKIYEYIRSLSSSFGWVPEYAQWRPQEEEFCETCCIKDMIECAYELTKVGYPEYWYDIDRFIRNQLIENQLKNADFVIADNTLPDHNGITYHDLDKRIVGGFSGGTLPNSFSLSKFRSIAGCCVGMAPVAMAIVWDNAIIFENGALIVNMPLDKSIPAADISTDYPNTGCIKIKVRQRCHLKVRKYPYMENLRATLDGETIEWTFENGMFVFHDVPCDGEITIVHSMETREVKEFVRGTEYTVFWRGSDVVDMLPRGEHVRMYQRDLSIPKYYPGPEDVAYSGAVNYGPTQQKTEE